MQNDRRTWIPTGTQGLTAREKQMNAFASLLAQQPVVDAAVNAQTRSAARIRTALRTLAGLGSYRCPVEIVPGDLPPRRTGRSYYHTNKSGDIIRHPSAYRKAYGHPIYHASSLAVVVGAAFAVHLTGVSNARR